MNRQMLNEITANTFEDRAHGCILGAFIADSLGAYLEFASAAERGETIEQCLNMNDCSFGIGPIPFTDDNE